MSPPLSAHRGAILHFLSDPGESVDTRSYEYFDDGLLLVENGRVARLGPAAELMKQLPEGTALVDHGRDLLLPGFVDTHIHYPQTDMIGAGGRDLLDWLERYTFPAEARFGDPAHAREVADFFLDELLRNGTTTALVFGSVHRASVDAFMQAAAARRLRMIAGKAMMDRECPPYLRDTPDSAERDNRELIERWHGHARLGYAITPRFAISCSEAQLQGAGRLAAQFPDVHVHSHLAENRREIERVRALFPERRSYLDVYAHYGLVRERSVYAHGIHLSDAERRQMAGEHSAIAFCPCSNLYLGSGLFDLAACDAAGLHFGVGTDVGGGNSFSLLRTLGDAYKVAQLKQQRLSPLRAFYLATRGGARALRLEDRIGSFEPEREADFVVLNLAATPLLARRLARTQSLAEKLLVLMAIGDDRLVRETYVLGEAVRFAHCSN